MATTQQTNRMILTAILCLGLIVLIAVALHQGGNEDEVPLGEGVVRLGDIPVADVNGTMIYLSDVRNVAQVQNPDIDASVLFPGHPMFEDVLDELIDQRLMALEALSSSLDQQAGARRRLAQARERILSNVLVETHLQTTVNEETARQLYEAQSSLRERGTEVRARHILVRDEESANLIREQLDAGESFATLALTYSLDRASRDNSGDLGYFTSDMLSPRFTQQAFNAGIGVVVGPFRSEQGWHIMEVMDRRRAPEPTFEDVKDDIMSRMTFDEIKNLLEGLREKASIEKLNRPLGEEALVEDQE